METKTICEEEILKEIQDLPESMQEKLVKMVHFLKKEIIHPELSEKNATDEFLSVCGTWGDDRTIDEQLKDIYLSRKLTTDTENV